MLEKEYGLQWDKLKEAPTKLKEKTEALTTQERLLETTQWLSNATKERSELLDEQNRIVERSMVVLGKVQKTYQTRTMDYEVQAMTTTTLIQRLKKEKEVTKDKVKMSINHIQMIIGGTRERMREQFVVPRQSGINGQSKQLSSRFSVLMLKIGRKLTTTSSIWMKKV